jgi:hypothetical protein
MSMDDYDAWRSTSSPQDRLEYKVPLGVVDFGKRVVRTAPPDNGVINMRLVDPHGKTYPIFGVTLADAQRSSNVLAAIPSDTDMTDVIIDVPFPILDWAITQGVTTMMNHVSAQEHADLAAMETAALTRRWYATMDKDDRSRCLDYSAPSSRHHPSEGTTASVGIGLLMVSNFMDDADMKESAMQLLTCSDLGIHGRIQVLPFITRSLGEK